jgi:prepilin-type N-terminal cleavage/methylation domain-containing protein
MKSKLGEKGFTLIELIVGISIAVFVTGAASMAIITMMRLSPQSNNWAIALRQVQNTGYWISRDVQMSQGEIDDNPPSPEFIKLTVPYESGGEIVNKTISYQFETINGQVWLMRNDSIGGQIAVAQYISNTDAQYDPDNDTLDFSIEATFGKVTVSRQYDAAQRVPVP